MLDDFTDKNDSKFIKRKIKHTYLQTYFLHSWSKQKFRSVSQNKSVYLLNACKGRMRILINLIYFPF